MVVTYSYNAGTNTGSATGAGNASFTGLVAADVAGGWGKFTADASGTQIYGAATINLGDGTNVLTFTDTLKQIKIKQTYGAGNVPAIQVNANATLTLGVAASSKQGCSIDFNKYSSRSIYNNGGTVNFYGCFFQGTDVRAVLLGVNVIHECVLDLVDIDDKTGADYRRITLINGYDGLRNLAGSLSDLQVQNSPYAVTLYTNMANGGILKGLVSVGNTKMVNVQNFDYWGDAENYYLVNAVSDAWTFHFASSPHATVFRQYEFDLTVRDSAGNPLEDATCTIDDAAATEIFNVDTDANGAITTQTVSRGYYNQANGDTLQDYGPHTLTITKAGYATYTAKVIFDMKLNLRIVLTSDAEAALYPALTGNASATDVLEGKTFYKDDAATQLTGTATFTVTTQMSTTETRVIYKKDPLRLPLMLATESLLIQNQRLKHKLRTQ
jgi:hypothetical protein